MCQGLRVYQSLSVRAFAQDNRTTIRLWTEPSHQDATCGASALKSRFSIVVLASNLAINKAANHPWDVWKQFTKLARQGWVYKWICHGIRLILVMFRETCDLDFGGAKGMNQKQSDGTCVLDICNAGNAACVDPIDQQPNSSKDGVSMLACMLQLS